MASLVTQITHRLWKDQAHTAFLDFTWTFAAPVTAGNYWDGSAWVLVNSATGPVSVLSVNPAPGAASLPNLSTTNVRGVPTPAGKQGVDSRLTTSFPANYNAGLTASYPIALAVSGADANKVIIASASASNTASNRPISTQGSQELLPGNTFSYVNGFGVLTSVSAIPGVDDFRPSYAGDPAARLYGLSMATVRANIQTLPNLSPVQSSPPSAYLVHLFKRPWVELMGDWHSRFVMGISNCPDYGEYWTQAIGFACLKICEAPITPSTQPGKLATTTMSPQQREDLVRGIVQLGIDLYGAWSDPTAGRTYGANGGQMGGRGLPIMVAGRMLGIAGMAAPHTVVSANNHFTEDETYYYDNTPDHAGSDYKVCHNTSTANANTIGGAGALGDGRGYQQYAPNDTDILVPPRTPLHVMSYGMEANGSSHVGLLTAALILGLRDSWDYTVTGTSGNNSSVVPLVGAAAITYSAARAAFGYLTRFCSPMSTTLAVEYTAANAGSISYWNGSGSVFSGTGFGLPGAYAIDMYRTYIPRFAWRGWVAYGSSKGQVDFNLPILTTQDEAISGATITLEIFNAPDAATISSTQLIVADPAPAPITSTFGSINYYLWYSSSSSGRVPTNTVIGTFPTAVNAYGYIKTSVTLPTVPATGPAQRGTMYQVLFQMNTGGFVATNGLLTLVN